MPKADLRRTFKDSAELRAWVRDTCGKRVALAFSCGKDALAAWLALRADGYEVVPFYMYLIPGLAFVEAALAYYERVFKCPILRVPNPNLTRMLRNYVFQPPERISAIQAMDLPNLTREDIDTRVRAHMGDPTAMIAIGNRAADSPMRLANIRRSGPIGWARKTFLPVYDWKINDVREAIAASGIKLPPDYRWFGRSFDGIDYRFTAPLKQHAPEDYARVKAWFPLIEADILRHEGRTP